MPKKIARSKKPARLEKKAGPPARKKKPDEETLPEFQELFADVKNPKQRDFLLAYVYSRRLVRAQRLSGVCRQSHYLWLDKDPLYPEYVRRAKRIIADHAEEEAYRRAFEGLDIPVIYRGEIRDYYKSYSDSLAMFMLKGMKPETYNRNNIADFGFEGPSFINITVKKDPNNPADADLPDRVTFALPGAKE
jgi:hypothetical protein